MTKSKWITIASADDDVISGELLQWSGLEDVWDEYDLNRYYDFLKDVVEYCSCVDIDCEDWDDDIPGRSGVWHKVQTDNPEQLKTELRSQLALRLWNKRRQITLDRLHQEKDQAQDQSLPKKPKHLCSADIWDDSFPTTYHYYIEKKGGSHGEFWLWERYGEEWKKTDLRLPIGSGIREASIRFARRLFFPITKEVVSISPGDLLTQDDIDDLI